jgi:hypothetical protein
MHGAAVERVTVNGRTACGVAALFRQQVVNKSMGDAGKNASCATTNAELSLRPFIGERYHRNSCHGFHARIRAQSPGSSFWTS